MSYDIDNFNNDYTSAENEFLIRERYSYFSPNSYDFKSDSGSSKSKQVPILYNLPTINAQEGRYTSPFVLGIKSDTDVIFDGSWEIFGRTYGRFYHVGPVYGGFRDYHKRNCSEQKFTLYMTDDKYWELVWLESEHVQHGEGSGLLSFGKKRKQWKEVREQYKERQKEYFKLGVEREKRNQEYGKNNEKIIQSYSDNAVNKYFEKKYNQLYKDFKNTNNELEKLSRKGYNEKKIEKYQEIVEKNEEIVRDCTYMNRIEKRKYQLDKDIEDQIKVASPDFKSKYNLIKQKLRELFEKNFFPKLFGNTDKKFAEFEELCTEFYAISGKEKASQDARNIRSNTGNNET